MAFWWVNQNQTYKHEITGFLWSPKRNSGGQRNQYYDNMTLVEPGDIIFSFKDTRIAAVGVAVSGVQSSPKPDFGKAGKTWNDDGWLVEVEFTELDNRIRPKDFIDLLAPHLPTKYSPLQANGNGIQSVYLAAVPHEMALVMIGLIGAEYDLALDKVVLPNVEEDLSSIEAEILAAMNIPETEKLQLTKARIGQGLFKSNVRIIENSCRLTGVTQRSMLRASHIKPWSKSENLERIDGSNGLLLSPHVDHLFDKGYITFKADGEMLLSPKLELAVLDHWHIEHSQNVGSFNSDQSFYLDFHQNEVFMATA